MMGPRCRHGHITTDCPKCQRHYGQLPAAFHLPPTTKPKTFSKGLTHQPPKPRSRGVPDHLFVCHDCYRRHRTGLATNPSHHACRSRLDLRRKELPLSA